MEETATLLRRCWAVFHSQSKFKGVADLPRVTRHARVSPWQRPRHCDSTSRACPSRSRASHVERARESRGRPETTKGPMSPHCQQWSLVLTCFPSALQQISKSQALTACREMISTHTHTCTRTLTWARLEHHRPPLPGNGPVSISPGPPRGFCFILRQSGLDQR